MTGSLSSFVLCRHLACVAPVKYHGLTLEDADFHSKPVSETGYLNFCTNLFKCNGVKPG